MSKSHIKTISLCTSRLAALALMAVAVTGCPTRPADGHNCGPSGNMICDGGAHDGQPDTGGAGTGGLVGSGGTGTGGAPISTGGTTTGGTGTGGAGSGGMATGGAATGGSGTGGAGTGGMGTGGAASGGVGTGGGATGGAASGGVGTGGRATGGAASGGNGSGGVPACATPCSATAYCADGTCQSRFKEFTIGAGSDPGYITSGSDGNLWFSAGYDSGGVVGGTIGRLTVGGTTTLFPVLTTNPTNLSVATVGIARGPDDNIWFGAVASDGKGYVGTMNASGVATNYQFSMSAPKLGRLAVGPDGNLWMPLLNISPAGGSNRIEVCSTSGSLNEIVLPDYTNPYGIAVASDSTVWFTQTAQPHGIGHLIPPGTFTTISTSSWGQNITVGADKNLWFTEPFADINAIGRLTAAGTFVEYKVPTASSAPWDIAKGPDGNVWFTERSANNIGVITPSGKITEYPTPATPYGITVGPDGNIWFTEPTAGKVVRFLVP